MRPRTVSFLSSPFHRLYSPRIVVTPKKSIQLRRTMAHTVKPAARVASQRKDVWSIVNEAAAASEKPVINLGQGFL